MAEYLILGAGLTGLSTAYHLEQNKIFDYSIFEKESRPGGLLKTHNYKGFLFDYTGHLIHISDNYFKNFLEQVCGLKNFTLSQRNSSIYSNGVFTLYPFQMNLYGLPIEIICECIEGYILRDKKIKTPKSFYQWVCKYFGYGLGKYFFFTYNSKLFDYSVKKITPSWIGRFVPSTTFKDIIKGAITQNISDTGYNSSFYYPKSGGIEFLISCIVEKITGQIKTLHTVSAIDLKNKIVIFKNGHQEKYKKLVSTIPLRDFLSLIINETSTNLSNTSKYLKCTSVVNFNLGFNKEEISPYHWIYFPEKKYPFYRLGFWNNISSLLVPDNTGALYGEYSYRADTKNLKTINKNVSKSIEQVLYLFGLKEKNIIVKKNLDINCAYVIYDQWRERNIKKILNILAQHSVYSIGRYGAWKYASMQEAVLDGYDVVKRLIK